MTLGGFGLELKTEDVARFGQLYLQKGEWNGRQLLPAAWVAAATARQTSNGSSPTSDWDQGYGYQFWRCRHGLYRGDGAHGQFCIVMPEQDAVVAITSGTRDLQGVMNAVWDNLLPALQAAALPADAQAQAQLRQRLASLSLRPVEGRATSPLGRRVARTYDFPENDQKLESLALQTGKGGATLVVRTRGGAEERIACGHGTWTKGRAAFTEDQEQPVAASGAWSSDDAYVARLCFEQTPFCNTATLRFVGDELELRVENNVNRDTKRGALTGHARAASAKKTSG